MSGLSLMGAAYLILFAALQHAGATRMEVLSPHRRSSPDEWQFELTGSWDITSSISDDRVSVVSERDAVDDMFHTFRVYNLKVIAKLVPHFTLSLRDGVEAISNPLDRTRKKTMILSNGQQHLGDEGRGVLPCGDMPAELRYVDLGLEGKGWFKHAGILEPSVLTVATEGKSLRELTTKVLQKARLEFMSNLPRRTRRCAWTTLTQVSERCKGLLCYRIHAKSLTRARPFSKTRCCMLDNAGTPLQLHPRSAKAARN